MLSRTTFLRSIIPKIYESEQNKCTKLSNAECNKMLPSLAFTSDVWSSRSLDHYLSFTVSCMTNNFTLRSIALENKPCAGTQTADDVID